MKILLIYRGKEYSPNMADSDALILQGVAQHLKRKGHYVRLISESDIEPTIQAFDVVCSMARNPETLAVLRSYEQKGLIVFNTPQSIDNCTRSRFTQIFSDNGIPQPASVICQPSSVICHPSSNFPPFPLWIKRGDGYSQQKDDVCYVEDEAEAQRVLSEMASRDYQSVVLSSHSEGDLIKFYGVRNSDFFYWYYASEGHSKFGLEQINGKEHGYAFSLDSLQSLCNRAADTLELDIYGGDCVVDAEGNIRIIDFNDWPSFSPCRDDAAKAIAVYVDSRLKGKKSYRWNLQSSLKSGDTEEWLDIVFTRPIGFRWACLFDRFDIHPNVVTILSIILGAACGFFFVHDADSVMGLILNIIGVLLLMWANFYDSCDGQLARMTGKKTRLGRILDGAAGDIWFISIYIAVFVRLYPHNIPFTDVQWGWWAFLLVAIAGLVCHGRQCGLSDYYRNIHLYFLKGKEGSELDNYQQQRQLYREARWKDDWIWKFFLGTYVNYTKGQEQQTPQFQRLMALLKKKYGGMPPQNFSDRFRQKSLPLMKWANILTFNTRAIILYVACLVDLPWLYPLLEIVVLTSLYLYMRFTHEHFCRQFTDELTSYDE